MASKVPKFGEWEGGQNFTVYFDTARKTKHNGQKINPNDPEEYPEMFQQSQGSVQAPTQTQDRDQTRADKQRKQTKVPHFGAWENEDTGGYTQCFEQVRKTRNGGPTVVEKEPQINPDVPRSDPPVPAKAQPQDQSRPVTREGRPVVPRFGDWESEGGGQGGYTVVFDGLKQKKHGPTSNAPKSNRDVGPTPQEGRAKVPEFGAWDGGEAVQYTEYFEKAQATKKSRPRMDFVEPQMNWDVGPTGRGQAAATRDSTSSVISSEGHRRQPSVDKIPVQPRANFRATGGRETKAAPIPHFGGWNTDPSQADGYTKDFARAKEDRQTPLNKNVHPAYQKQPHYINQKQPRDNNQKQQPGCCSIL